MGSVINYIMKNSILYIIIIAFVFSSCKEKSSTSELNNIPEQKKISQITDANVNAEGVFLFSGEHEIIANWTEHGVKKNENILNFSFYNKETSSFSKPIKVTAAKGLQYHSESMAKVAITKSGILYALFRIKSKKSKSMYGGTLYYTTSTDRGQNWSNKKKLVIDEKSTSQSFYDVAQLPDGELGLIWLDNRKLHKNRKGQTLYFSKTNKSLEFETGRAIEGSVCQCCRTDIDVVNNSINIAFRNMIEPNEFGYPRFLHDSEDEIRDMYCISSKDNGVSFSKSKPISDDNWRVNGCPHTGPSLASTQQLTGALWFTAANNESGLYFNIIGSNNFNKRTLISKEGKHPQMTALNDKFYLTYEEYYEKEGKGYTKIMLQERTDKALIGTKEISAPKTNNHHAVLKAINNNTILLSWANNDVRNSSIQYRLINSTK